MKIYLALLVCFFSSFGFSQSENVSDLITKKIIANHPPVHKHYRSVMQPKKNVLQIINPFNYISIGLMFTYQRVITQQLNGSCAYENSCSQFTKKAINYYGLVKGSLIGLNQLQTCYPTSYLDYPNHKINHNLKIKNPIPVLNED